MDNENEGDILTAYALRFDGFAARERLGEQHVGHLVDAVVDDLAVPADPLEQFACFFNLQRYLCKWGGERLPTHSFAWRAYRTLFLLTTMADVPEGLAHGELHDKWSARYLPRRGAHLAAVAAAHAAERYAAPAHLPSETKDSASLVRYYHAEDYLFDHVGHGFRSGGRLTAFDFFTIVIWKANRAKSVLARRLLKQFPGQNLEQIVDHMGGAIRSADGDQERLRTLMVGYGLRLPMASAVLTVLYPDDFTVFDVRACESLGFPKALVNACGSTKFEKVWPAYVDFCRRVQRTHPTLTHLRDKDRALWAASACDQLVRNIADGFPSLKAADAGE